MHRKWQQLSSRYLIKRWWMNLREDHVRLPNGVEMEEYHVLEYPDWTCIVPITDEGDVVMVEQYRYGIDQVTMELPGGAIQPEEPALGAAKRELLEETGFGGGDWSFVGKSAPDPSRHTNWAWFFVAKGVESVGRQQLDEGEQIRVTTVPIADAIELALSGRMAHAVHMTALLWADRKGLL
jgi:8-oxo-dGTP pyrophosphatase MutT (NUDIX family)